LLIAAQVTAAPRTVPLVIPYTHLQFAKVAENRMSGRKAPTEIIESGISAGPEG
jgi:hypothetical protein